MYDFHVHSHFSPDSQALMEDLVKKAIEKNILEICFTDHIDYDYVFDRNGGLKFEFNPQEYFTELERVRKKYEGKITICSGIEMGIQPHLLERCDQTLNSYNFDFILASVHNVNKTCLTKRILPEQFGVSELWHMYFTEMLSSIKLFSNFQVLGHIDVPKRYNSDVAAYDIAEYYPLVREIYQQLISMGKGLEVNSAGYYYGLNDNNPSRDLLKIYKECGGEIVTFGSDAHTIERVGEHYTKSTQLLREIGFKYVCTFKNQRPIFHSIR